jgi:hypothetical protein
MARKAPALTTSIALLTVRLRVRNRESGTRGASAVPDKSTDV